MADRANDRIVTCNLESVMHPDVGIGLGFFGLSRHGSPAWPKARHNTNNGGLGRHDMNDRAGLGLPSRHDGQHDTKQA